MTSFFNIKNYNYIKSEYYYIEGDNIKKLVLTAIVIILVPSLIVNIFIRDDEIKFLYHENMLIRVKRTNGSIEEVPFEEYIIGVLAGEMPINFDIEALKAQAVASRSYVMKKMAINKDNNYDILDTSNNQVYLDNTYLKEVWKENYTNNINKLKVAVLETKGEYLEYNNEVIEAFFFSTSPGKTQNSEDVFNKKVSYLRSVESEWDKKSPSFNCNTYYTLKDFCKKLDIDCVKSLDIKVINKTSNDSIKKIKINNKTFDGIELRKILSLKSTYFNIVKKDSNIIINTKGYGHGVGMSQYGALGMAKEGYTYDEILKYYYNGVNIKKI